MSQANRPYDFPQPRSATRWAALDGLRALSVVIVMLYHFAAPQFIPGGYIGVDVFFVLSGFLITSLLLSERARFGAVSFGRFYMRRALRLFPALVLLIIFAVLMVSVISGLAPQKHATLIGVPWAVFYLGNWKIGFTNGYTPLGLINHTWSLAVEEQYYLIWPAVLVTLLRRYSKQTVGWLLAVATVLVWIVRLIALGHVEHNKLYYLTPFHCDGLLLGSALAVLLDVRPDRFARLASRWSGVLSLVVLVSLAAVGSNVKFRIEEPVWITGAVIASGVLLVSLVTDPHPVVERALTHPIALWVGTRSYGLYLWHFAVYATLDALIHVGPYPRVEADTIGFVASFVLAAASFRFFEQPFLRLKARFERTSQPVATDRQRLTV